VARLPEDFADLVEHWTLLPAELDLQAGKHDGASKLAFSLLLKFYGRYGRFPRGRSELKREAVDFVAAQVKVPAADLGFYEWDGRTIKRHRAEIRRFFGFREFTVADGEKLADWLAGDYAQRVRPRDMVREQFLAECRSRQLEPPTPKQVDRIVGSALARAGEAVALRVYDRIEPATRARLLALVETTESGAGDEVDEDPGLLRWVKSSPGDVSLKTMLDEIAKLEAVRSFALPEHLMRDVAVKVAGEWVTGALIESPSHLRRHSGPLRVAMLAALLVARQQQITDQLVRLLISTVHRIGLRAEKKGMREMVAQFTRVTSKESLLLKVADAAVHRPDDTVRQVVYPVLGEETLRNLAAVTCGHGWPG
jgi:hypothetical protein